MLSWQPPLVLVHEEKPLSIKRERKAFVYIANASSEIKKNQGQKEKRMSELIIEEGFEDLS